MRKATKLLALTMAMLLVFLAACSNSKSSTESNSNAANANASSGNGSEKEADKGDDLKPIKLTMFATDLNTNYENMKSPVGMKITELTGVTLEIDYPVGDPQQKISLMAASGEYPDLVFAKNDVNMLIEAGGLIDLAPLIEEHGPNIKKLYGDYMKRLRWSKDDDSIYFLGTYGVNDERWTPNDGFMLQHAVVKELGYPAIKTVQDFENAIRAYMEKYPTIDGQPTIGLSLLADDWRIAQSVTNPGVFSTGGSDDGEWYVDDATQKPVIHYTRPEEKEYFKWLNHMYNSGLVDPESFVQKYDQYKAKIAAGRVLGLVDSAWQFLEPQQALRQSGKDERTYGMYPVQVNENTKNRDFQSAGYSGGVGVGISTSAKDPVRIIKFLDWLCSEEAQILNNWGIEGEHYTVVNGKRVISEEEMNKRTTDPQYGKKTGIGVYLYPFPEQGRGVVDSTGNTFKIDSREQIIDTYSSIEKEVLAGYGAELWADLYPQASEFPVKPWGSAWQINIPQDSDGAVIMQKITELVRKRIPEMILAEPTKFDAMWESFQADLDKAGVHKLEQQFEGLLQERIELYNE